MAKIKVYIVGDPGPERNSVISIHKTYEDALKAWNKHRLELLKDAKTSLSKNKKDEMRQRIVNNPSCENPDKVDNYPHETTYIKQWNVNE